MLKIEKKLIKRNEHFLLDRKHLIDFAKIRDITLSNKLLDSYEQFDLYQPILIEDDIKYYDQFQIYELALLHVSIQSFVSGIIKVDSLSEEIPYASLVEALRKNDWLKQRRDDFLIFLPLLLKIRYFYLPEILGFVTLRAYKSESSDEELKPQTYEEWEKDKTTFDAKHLLTEFNISVESIDSFRTNLASLSRQLDPAKDWYTFLKKIKKSSSQTFQAISGNLRLAYDLYEMADMITLFLEKSTGEPWIQPEEIFDLSGGAWKRAKCQNCYKEFTTRTIKERFCISCKNEIVTTTKGAWKCKSCNSVLQKYLDGNEIFNESFPSAKGRENKLPISITVEYGLVTLASTCPKCKTINYYQVSSGWI